MDEEYKTMELTLEEAHKTYGGSHIEDKIVLIDDLSLIPTPLIPRRTNCYIMGVCLSGWASYTLGTKECEVKPGDAILINEGQVMDNYTTSPDLTGIGYFLSNDFFNDVFHSIRGATDLYLFQQAHPVFHLNESEVEDFKAYFYFIKKKIEKSSHQYRVDLIRSSLTTMFYDLSDVMMRYKLHEPRAKNRAEIIFDDFIRLLETNFRQQRSVNWYSNQLCISAKYLSEAVTQASHRSPTAWINYYVTLEIRLMLKNSNMDIKEIARQLNFSNQSFMGRYFKKHIGMSPSEYRLS